MRTIAPYPVPHQHTHQQYGMVPYGMGQGPAQQVFIPGGTPPGPGPGQLTPGAKLLIGGVLVGLAGLAWWGWKKYKGGALAEPDHRSEPRAFEDARRTARTKARMLAEFRELLDQMPTYGTRESRRYYEDAHEDRYRSRDPYPSRSRSYRRHEADEE